jgi:hypothetical protein
VGTTTATPFTAIVSPAPAASAAVTPGTTGTTGTTGIPPATTGTTGVPPAATANATRKFTLPDTSSSNQTATAEGQHSQDTQRLLKYNKAKEIINNSTAKNITILQGALDKAPVSVKSNLNSAISQTITTNNRILLENKLDTNRNSGTFKRGQNTASDNDTNANNDDDNTTNDSTRPNINKKTLVNPSDRFQNKTNPNTDNKIVK